MKVFFDLDECIISTRFEPWTEQEGFCFTLDGDPRVFHTKPRQCCNELFCRLERMIGAHSLYVLTSSAKDYATKIIEETGWPFVDAHIFTREDILKGHHYFGDANIILVDNMYHRNNIEKLMFLDIDSDDYLQVSDYHGAEGDKAVFDDFDFVETVIDFVEERL